MPDQTLNKTQQIIILFDGACLLCNSFIKIPMRYSRGNFLYVSSHSKKGIDICDDLNISSNSKMDSVYLIYDDNLNFKKKSDAVIEILRSCGFIFGLIAKIIAVFPKFIRDYFYDLISKNRSLKNSRCKIPKNLDPSKVYL
ncbi:thiol-disulfide oxidoreductase DCC family protein [Ichthyobacterium seriolicida]|uniref:thiol-disulfide oxidoreductase DCC family protein n=1 Tax=Ichthyobacterium seriolicida TaxID=242600 RepID=UPI000BBC8C2C|nr:DUF393 domain-containing protein [Ichthyobacterium seriolicida]